MDDSNTNAELHKVCDTSEFSEENVVVLELEDESIAVFCVDGEYKAISNVCPHQGGPIGKGKVEDGCVYCPWHGWKFDLETGKHAQGVKNAAAYDIVVEDDTVYVRL